MSFSFRLNSNGNDHTLHLVGAIDENASFGEIPIPLAGSMTLDLKNITMLNSLGLRSWVQWVARLQHLNSLQLANCPNAVVHQMNILDGFLPLGAVIKSIEVPYYCETCGKETHYTAERGRDYFEATADKDMFNGIKNVMPCSHCNELAEADFMPGKYFKFLKRRLG